MNRTNSDLEKNIKRGITDLTPDQKEKIWEIPAEQATGKEWYLDGTDQKKQGNHSRKIISWMSAVAACCVIGLLSLYMTTLRAEATIYFDVNPSVELQINQKERVVSAKANNADGKVVLEDMDLKHTDVDVAVNALLGSMVKHGYLNETKQVVLLSVESKDPEKGEQLRGRLTKQVEHCLNQQFGESKVWNQNISSDQELKRLAKKYEMTPGKASFVNKIVEHYPHMEYGMLAKMSMSELALYLEEQQVDLEDLGISEAERDELEKKREQLEMQQELEKEEQEAEEERLEELAEEEQEKIDPVDPTEVEEVEEQRERQQEKLEALAEREEEQEAFEEEIEEQEEMED